MEAVILAGGKGTRLRPYTVTLPKPLVPVGERPILEIVIDQLRRAGVTRVTMAVSHMAELIKAFFGSGERFGVEIVYSIEDKPLGTVAPITLIENLPDTFFVMNGDILTDLDYRQLYESHLANRAKLTVATYQREVNVDFGVLTRDKQTGHIATFQEKPNYSFDVSMGVYVFSKSLLERVPRGRPYGFDDLVIGMLKDNDPIHAFPFDGYWLDIGRPEDYEEANRSVANDGTGPWEKRWLGQRES